MEIIRTKHVYETRDRLRAEVWFDGNFMPPNIRRPMCKKGGIICDKSKDDSLPSLEERRYCLYNYDFIADYGVLICIYIEE